MATLAYSTLDGCLVTEGSNALATKLREVSDEILGNDDWRAVEETYLNCYVVH